MLINHCPQVTVCLPTYNSGEFLTQAIDSVLQQTFTDFELIISDDCSNDNTPEIIKNYLQKDNRIRYLRNSKNLGLFTNWNQCLESANGEYITIFAQDDVMLPKNLEQKVKILDKYQNIGLVTSSVMVVDANNNHLNWNWANYPEDKLVNGKEWARNILGEANPICCPFVLMRRQVLEKVGGKFNENYAYAADLELWLRIALVADLYFVKEILGYYRWHEGNKTHSFDDFYQVKEHLQICSDLIDSFNLSDPELNYWESEVLSRTVKWVSFYRIYHYLEKGNFDEAFKLSELLENWRGKSVKLSISVQELGTRIQKILQVNSRLKFEVDEYKDWVKNLENKNSVLEMKINQLNDEKKWLESQIKAWIQTAQKYYQENRK
ncbi:MAG: glycosyltransferase [Okeania sp. SIO2G4]|uniref:glycosyltransferase n=1 Tax=unclassified Okeania TaxID=2634635 RepID=UPI0013BB313A|nr:MULTISPECIES: glycosyltransferase [unclassified Okeania]NEP03551.1 glycosyltransferase [Okeania sp. SIO4D6]NEP38777.1 glycosyltransferase [Okeania sp. SIO2H7]NEP74377.1 glycosyltransferase [Okeania sp. SIO2G5]NEP95428.1 glycosyltransferase [Okeania sp. SIO2F5]NEQ93146.1 glycosyltransferase [Okeania sp. SIO2G4]